MRATIASASVTVLVCLGSGGVASAQDAVPGAAPTSAASLSAPMTMAAASPDGAPTSLDLPAPESNRSPINRPLLATSLVLIGGTYGASVIAASVGNRDADRNNLYYPVVGPWMDYANRGCNAERSCPNETTYKTLLVLDGVGQALGAIGIITSLFIPERANQRWYMIGGSSLHAAPSSVGTGYGLGAAGVF